MIKLKLYSNGDKHWVLDFRLHRANGPAVTWDDGTNFWYWCGLRHRVDGPAIIDNDGSDGGKWWYWHGQEVTEYEHMMLSAQEQAND